MHGGNSEVHRLCFALNDCGHKLTEKNPRDGKKCKKVEKLVLFASSKETSRAGEISKRSLKSRSNKKSAHPHLENKSNERTVQAFSVFICCHTSQESAQKSEVSNDLFEVRKICVGSLIKARRKKTDILQSG